VEPSIEDAVGTGKHGRPPKRLSENPGDKTSHKILDQILNNLMCVADEHRLVDSLLVYVRQQHTSGCSGSGREFCGKFYHLGFH
jgi:hypothetical protein